MITVINDFNTRVKEIDGYFKLLDSIINQDAKLFFPNKKSHKFKKIDDELIKVMKANCFLLLYNLIESSIKLSITEIYDSITLKTKKYDDVKDEIRKIWISENYKNFKDKGTDYIFNTINTIAQDIIDIQFKPEKVISGNIDGMKIREFSLNFGFSNTTHHSAKNGVKLHQVKKQRNDLAHGAVSFSQCGRQYTYEDLFEIKQQVIIYLRGILNNINSYLNNEHYNR
ncbi:MAG: hypothetical protein CVU11_01085 [Bacteroidetes bacterium HGW-Bacteroidetes-6]|jgi:hypothetical protein|nr:MAG: hypothetical protein CVU11_01085 [Bacteroidetes bacterium HGW-Bacteroidetes-6]